MSNHIEYSNTPIFDELSRERGYNRLIARGAIQMRPAYIDTKYTEGLIAEKYGVDPEAVTVPSTALTYAEVIALAEKFSKPEPDQHMFSNGSDNPEDWTPVTIDRTEMQGPTPKIMFLDESDDLDAEPIVLNPSFWKMNDEE